MMPISDSQDYDDGHFSRVYKHVIKPACESAALTPTRADDIKNTNYIVLDILRRIISSDLVLCDLSSRNPNVLYELGIRQAFNLPVVLIKDQNTERIFDIQGFRTYEYDSSLRVDTVQRDVKNLSSVLKETLTSKGKDVNSLIELLGVKKAEIGQGTEISAEASLILNSVKDLSHRISSIEEDIKEKTTTSRKRGDSNKPRFRLPNGQIATWGETIYHFGVELGKLVTIDNTGVVLLDQDADQFVIPPDSDQYNDLSIEIL